MSEPQPPQSSEQNPELQPASQEELRNLYITLQLALQGESSSVILDTEDEVIALRRSLAQEEAQPREFHPIADSIVIDIFSRLDSDSQSVKWEYTELFEYPDGRIESIHNPTCITSATWDEAVVSLREGGQIDRVKSDPSMGYISAQTAQELMELLS